MNKRIPILSYFYKENLASLWISGHYKGNIISNSSYYSFLSSTPTIIDNDVFESYLEKIPILNVKEKSGNNENNTNINKNDINSDKENLNIKENINNYSNNNNDKNLNKPNKVIIFDLKPKNKYHEIHNLQSIEYIHNCDIDNISKTKQKYLKVMALEKYLDSNKKYDSNVENSGWIDGISVLLKISSQITNCILVRNLF